MPKRILNERDHAFGSENWVQLRLFEIKDLAAFSAVFAATDLGLQQLPKLKIDVRKCSRTTIAFHIKGAGGKTMSAEKCKQCGEMMTEQPTAYETVNLQGVPRHSDRFYEQWFVCRNGHRKGYISGHGRAPGVAKVISETSVVTVRT